MSLPRGPVTGEPAYNHLGHKETLCAVNLCSRLEIITPVRLSCKEALLTLHIVKNRVGRIKQIRRSLAPESTGLDNLTICTVPLIYRKDIAVFALQIL